MFKTILFLFYFLLLFYFLFLGSCASLPKDDKSQDPKITKQQQNFPNILDTIPDIR